MITSKQRAKLRALANNIDPILSIGKENITENVIKQLGDALEAREIVKCVMQKGSDLSPREACDILAQATKAEPVQVIGNKIVLYRAAKEPKIVL